MIFCILHKKCYGPKFGGTPVPSALVKTNSVAATVGVTAAATAKMIAATLVTRDKEMKTSEEAGEFSVLWLN